MSDLKPYSGVRCMCLATGCSAGPGCPHYTGHCKAHIAHQNAQPAQAGQVLTDEEIDAAYEKARADYQRSRFAVRGQQLTAQDSPDWWFARAIEQAVLAKRVPQWQTIETAPKDGTEILVYVRGDSVFPTAAAFKSRDYFEKEYGDPEYMEEGWYWAFGYPSDFHEETITPTHWMPLPPPPGIVGEKGGA